jgi:hypothetical protein
MGENLCQFCIWQRIDNQNIQGAQKTNPTIINNSFNKWADELNRQSSKEVQMANKH